MKGRRLKQALKAFKLIAFTGAVALWWFGYPVAAFALTMVAPAIVVAEDVWSWRNPEPITEDRRRHLAPTDFAILFGLVGVILGAGFVLIGDPSGALFMAGVAAVGLMIWVTIRAAKVPNQR
jgi:hypothetical protein